MPADGCGVVVVQNSDKGITVQESFDDFLTTAEYWLSPDVISEVADAAGEDYVEDIE